MSHHSGLEAEDDIGRDHKGHDGKDDAQHIARIPAGHQPTDKGAQDDERRPELEHRHIQRTTLVVRPGAHDASGDDDGQRRAHRHVLHHFCVIAHEQQGVGKGWHDNRTAANAQKPGRDT